MTERRYYDDAYTMRFTARVRERVQVDGQPAVILDATYFYPTGGGQPHDVGQIGDVNVVDVVTRDEDAAVLHVLAGDAPGSDDVTCQIDRARRFDHMQHHTGQHILTQAFVEVAEAQTVGFHLGSDVVTIDLDQPVTDDRTLAGVEELANRIIWEDRPVTVRIMDMDEIDGVRMRSRPEHLLTDGLRVIEVADFDVTACGGTHVARTGEIGLLKIINITAHGDGIRVEFLCGGRALRDYREKNTILLSLAADLTCGYWEVDAALERLRDDLKDMQRARRAALDKLVSYDAERLLADARLRDSVHVITAPLVHYDAGNARALASRLIEEEAVVALLGVPGEETHFVFACSEALPYNMNPVLQVAFDALGDGRGGGRPNFVQGDCAGCR